MPVKIPASYMRLIQEMSKATGIPITVLVNQANLESGFNANAVSPAGAEGWLQFLPSTYNAYAGKAGVPPGTEFNPADEAKVYIQFVNALEQEFHGNLRDVLAAYNAGPGNIGAGMGYASEILGNYSGLAGARVNPPPMDAHQLHLNHLAQTAAAGRTPMNHPRLGAPNVGPVPPVGQTRTVRGSGPTPRITGTAAGTTAHQAHLLHLAHLARTGQSLPARTQLQGGRTPPPTNRGTGGTRIVNR